MSTRRYRPGRRSFSTGWSRRCAAKTDLDFLKRMFGRLTSNFGWWVNRKDRFGRSLFEGGFLGLDNIGVFDRSAPLPTGGHLEQADGTAWVALFCQNMLEIAFELAAHDPTYEELAANYAMEFVLIARAMNGIGPGGMWDEEDGFYYDVLRLPDGTATRLKVRSMVGLLPLCAATAVEKWQRERVPRLTAAMQRALRRMPELRESIHATGPGHFGVAERGIMGLVNQSRLRRILTRMLDENEFLSPYGIRSLSRYHAEHPYVFSAGGQEYRVSYLPAELDSGMFGGNSNWRGPIWMPVNALIIRALMHYFSYYGDNFKIECPTGSGNLMNLFEVAREITNRLTRIFLRDESGRRPVFGGAEKFQRDPHWRDNLLFYEYFHGDNGAGHRRQPSDGMDRGHRRPDRHFWQARCRDLSARRPGSGLWPRDRDGVGDDHGDRPTLSNPFSDQYPRLAQSAVARGRQTGNPGRHRRRDDRRLCRKGLRLDLAVERMADRRRRTGRFAQQPAMARRVPGDPARLDRGRHLRLRLCDHCLHRQRCAGRRDGVGAIPRKAGKARHQAVARLRAEPYRPRPSLGEDPSRLLCRRQ